MDAAFALEVLDKAPYITVSFMRPDGTPYGVPLSLARTDEKTFYFHCALEGEIDGSKTARAEGPLPNRAVREGCQCGCVVNGAL